MTAVEPSTVSGVSDDPLAGISDFFLADADRIVIDIATAIATRIPDLSNDPQLIDLLHASVRENLVTVAHVIRQRTALEDLRPGTAVAEYAIRLAQRDVPISALTRAYQIGHGMALRLVLDSIERLQLPEKQAFEALREASDAIDTYLDQTLMRVTQVYEQENRRWWSARAAAQATAIRRFLQGADPRPEHLESVTNYRLGQTHLAVIVWAGDDSARPEVLRRLDQIPRRLAAELGAAATCLITAADRTTVWGWIGLGPRVAVSVGDGIELELREIGARMSLGTPQAGPSGFIASHRGAQAAHEVAMRSRPHQDMAVITYGDVDVALLAILLREPQMTEAWVRSVLGPFAAVGMRNLQMRQTLAAHFGTGENFSRTADVLGVHRNTVARRVARFAEEAGKSNVSGLDIALAVRLYDVFASKDEPFT